jgi:general secretion pathway protein K
LDEVASEALVDGAMSAAGYLLFAAGRDPLLVDGLVLRFEAGVVELTVADEAARIDINVAEPEVLARLFTATGSTSMSAPTFAARILDWRDADSDVHVGGAEIEEYRKASVSHELGNRRFYSAEELRFVLGLTAGDFSKLEPFVTVFNLTGRVDPSTAPRQVLLALPRVAEQDVRRLIASRNTGASRYELSQILGGGSEYLLPQPSGAYRVTAKARLANGFVVAARATLMADPDDAAGYRIVAWSRSNQ